MILAVVEDKNPEDERGWTPLHVAAKGGHVRICKMILPVIENKNPRTLFGITPISLAQQNDHLNICNMIQGAEHNASLNTTKS